MGNNARSNTFKKEQRLCRVCGKPFFPAVRNQIICSDECRRIRKNQQYKDRDISKELSIKTRAVKRAEKSQKRLNEKVNIAHENGISYGMMVAQTYLSETHVDVDEIIASWRSEDK